MARYMLLFELDTSRTPEDAKAKKAQWLSHWEWAAKQLKDGVIKEWGVFAGETCGYTIFEGSSVELHTLVGMWVPFVKIKVKELMTVDEFKKAIKALPE